MPSPVPPQPPPATQFSSDEVIAAGHHFFGSVSRDLALIVEKAVSHWGLPNGYILGEEAGGAFIGGLRYGDGTLYTKNAGDVRVYWQGPSLGFDYGADGGRTMMLVYNLPRNRGYFRAVRRCGRLGIFGRRPRHDGACNERYRGRADPLGRRAPPRCQFRLSQIHAGSNLEPVLIREPWRRWPKSISRRSCGAVPERDCIKTKTANLRRSPPDAVASGTARPEATRVIFPTGRAKQNGPIISRVAANPSKVLAPFLSSGQRSQRS